MRRSSLLPAPDAPASDWQALIEEGRRTKNVVLLQLVIESRPGSGENARAQLLHQAFGALITLDPREVGRTWPDFLESPHRDVRLAAMNARFAVALPSEREELLLAWSSDPDPVVRAKAEALRNAVR